MNNCSNIIQQTQPDKIKSGKPIGKFAENKIYIFLTDDLKGYLEVSSNFYVNYTQEDLESYATVLVSVLNAVFTSLNFQVGSKLENIENMRRLNDRIKYCGFDPKNSSVERGKNRLLKEEQRAKKEKKGVDEILKEIANCDKSGWFGYSFNMGKLTKKQLKRMILVRLEKTFPGKLKYKKEKTEYTEREKIEYYTIYFLDKNSNKIEIEIKVVQLDQIIRMIISVESGNDVIKKLLLGLYPDLSKKQSVELLQLENYNDAIEKLKQIIVEIFARKMSFQIYEI